MRLRVGCTRIALLAGAASVVAVCAAVTRAQQGGVFRSGTILVPVDVRVIDRDGKAVTDLTARDFTVLENGVPQTIQHFLAEPVATDPAGTPPRPRPRGARSEDEAPQTNRLFLIILGRGRLQEPAMGVDGLIHFVHDLLRPQDLVAVMAWNRATDFTVDHAKILGLLTRFKAAHPKIEAKLASVTGGLAGVYGRGVPPQVQADIDALFANANAPAPRTMTGPDLGASGALGRDIQASAAALQTGDIQAANPNRPNLDVVNPAAAQAVGNLTFDEYATVTAQTLQDLNAIYAGIDYLRRLDGEKHLIFVSQNGLLLHNADDDRSVASAASDGRVAIDIVHTGGVPLDLDPLPVKLIAGQQTSTEPASAMTARRVSDLTGGVFLGNVSAVKAFDRINAASLFSYQLGYYPAEREWNGQYRRIEVKVNRPGLTVLYRHGYFANEDVAPLDLRQKVTYTRIASAGSYTGDIHDIKVKGSAFIDPDAFAAVSIKMTIDASRVIFTTDGDRHVARLDVSVFCGDRREQLVCQSWKIIDLRLKDDTYQKYLKDGIPLSINQPIEGKPSYVKIVVYDFDADLLGATLIKLV